MVTDAYQGLKSLVIDRLRGGGVEEGRARTLVEQANGAVPNGREVMTGELVRVGVDDPIVEAAERLLELLKDKGKYQVTLNDARGIVVGDHAVQHNTFN